MVGGGCVVWCCGVESPFFASFFFVRVFDANRRTPNVCGCVSEQPTKIDTDWTIDELLRLKTAIREFGASDVLALAEAMKDAAPYRERPKNPIQIYHRLQFLRAMGHLPLQRTTTPIIVTAAAATATATATAAAASKSTDASNDRAGHPPLQATNHKRRRAQIASDSDSDIDTAPVRAQPPERFSSRAGGGGGGGGVASTPLLGPIQIAAPAIHHSHTAAASAKRSKSKSDENGSDGLDGEPTFESEAYESALTDPANTAICESVRQFLAGADLNTVKSSDLFAALRTKFSAEFVAPRKWWLDELIDSEVLRIMELQPDIPPPPASPASPARPGSPPLPAASAVGAVTPPHTPPRPVTPQKTHSPPRTPPVPLPVRAPVVASPPPPPPPPPPPVVKPRAAPPVAVEAAAVKPPPKLKPKPKPTPPPPQAVQPSDENNSVRRSARPRRPVDPTHFISYR